MAGLRRLPAVRDKRQQTGTNNNPGQPVIVPGFPLTGPTVITQISTIGTIQPTAVIRPPPSPPSLSPVITSSSTTTSVTTSPSIALSSVAPPSLPSPSIIPPDQTNEDNAPKNKNNNDSALKSNGLSGGVIAGIVVGIILLLLILAFFLFRRYRLQQRRSKRNNASWLVKGGIEGGANGVVAGATSGYTFANNADEEKYTASATNLPPLQPVRGPYPYAMAPNAPYNYNDAEISPRTVIPASLPVTVPPVAASPVPVASVNLASFLVTVRCTFLPNLPDELQINPGETLRVVQDFDDGWALCVKVNTGEQGMVPVECFDKQSRLTIGGDPGLQVNGEMRADKRVSSLAGTGVNGRI